MGVAIELFFVFLAFCWVAGEGVPWTLLFVPAYLGLLTLKITPVGRKIKRTRVFMAFLTLFVFVAFGIGALAFRVLSDPVESIASSQLYEFFVDPLVLRLLWSGVIGAAVGIEVLAVLLVPIGISVAHGKYGDFEQYKAHKAQATRTAIYGFLGLSKGTWEVREGKLEVLDQPDGSLARFGGPGELIVQEGHAVILERNGNVSDVVGSGLTFLKAFERVSMVIPLHTRYEPIVVWHLASRDKVLIEEFEFLVFHRVDRGPELSQVRDGRYSYNRDILLSKVWSPSGGDWRKAVESISSRAARDVMGRYDLTEIFPLTEAIRVEFNRQLMAQINSITIGALGVEIVAVDTGKMLVSPQIEEKLVSQWTADWEQNVSANSC